MPEAYSDAFWWSFLIVSLVGLFWLALREDVRDALRDPDPTEDITKTRAMGCYTGKPAKPAAPPHPGGIATRRP